MKKILIPVALIGLCLSCEIASASPADDARQARRNHPFNLNLNKTSGNMPMAKKPEQPSFLSKLFGQACCGGFDRSNEYRTNAPIHWGNAFH
ncbi:hypothetical protein HOD08_03740 [bacterium]|nr:hypothetical protein [bacterium]